MLAHKVWHTKLMALCRCKEEWSPFLFMLAVAGGGYRDRQGCAACGEASPIWFLEASPQNKS